MMTLHLALLGYKPLATTGAAATTCKPTVGSRDVYKIAISNSKNKLTGWMLMVAFNFHTRSPSWFLAPQVFP